MSIFIGMTIMNGRSHTANVSEPPATAISLTAFSRDRTVFDSGAAFGLSVAEVPLTGTGTAGQIVEARAVTLDDGGDGSQPWAEIATIGESGAWAGTITAPRSASWYRAQVRIKSQPATAAQSAERFGVGHVMAIWGQSEVARFWDGYYSQTAPEPLVTLRGAVERLRTDAGSNGRQSRKALKLPGTDPLPPGVSWAAPSLTITLTAAVTLEDWDFTGFRVTNAATAQGTVIRNCRFGQAGAVPGLVGYLDCAVGGRIERVEFCDFTGYGGDKGAGYAIKTLVTGNGADLAAGEIGLITRCRFRHLTSDAIKMTNGRVEWCYFGWSRTLDQIPAEWQAATSYGLDAYVYNASGHAFRSLTAGNTGNAVPSDKSDNAFWQNIDPHVDAVTIFGAIGNPTVAFCHIDMPKSLAAGCIGMNNAVRVARNESTASQVRFDRATVEYCVMTRAADEVSRPFEVTDGGQPNWQGPVTLRHNWIGKGAAAAYLLDPGNGEAVIWTGNTDHDSGAPIPAPAGTQQGSGSAIGSDEAVQMAWFDGASVQHRHLSSSDPVTASLTAMANTLIAERGGDKFLILHHSLPGTDPRALVNDGDPQRMWANDRLLHDFATADGQHVGIAAMSWFAAPGSLGASYGEALFPLFTGKRLNGTTVSFPAEITYGSAGSYHADHWFGELYDYAHTRWVPYGPHRFDIGEDPDQPGLAANDMLNATTRRDLTLHVGLNNKELARESWRAMLASPQTGGIFLPYGLEPLPYQNGRPHLAGTSWDDFAHPRADVDDGLPMLARLTAQAMLQSAGLVGWPVAEFDRCEWQPDGSFAEVWSSAGAVSTPRLLRGLAALGPDFAHWTDVFGWQIDGAPAHRAEITGGRVRIYPNTGSFSSTTVLSYGEGGANGMIEFPEDYQASAHLNLPVVDVGAWGIDGVPLRTLPDPLVLASTVPPAPQSTLFTTAAAGPYFTDPVAFGANSGKLTLKIRAAVFATGGTVTLGAMSGNSYFRLECLASGGLRLRVRDSALVTLVDGVGGGVLTFGAMQEIMVSIDLPGLYARVWLDGALIINATFGANTGLFPTTTRVLSALATNAGIAQTIANVERIVYWKDATPTSAEPAALPYKEIVGPAAVANANAWKLGANAV